MDILNEIEKANNTAEPDSTYKLNGNDSPLNGLSVEDGDGEESKKLNSPHESSENLNAGTSHQEKFTAKRTSKVANMPAAMKMPKKPQEKNSMKLEMNPFSVGEQPTGLPAGAQGGPRLDTALIDQNKVSNRQGGFIKYGHEVEVDLSKSNVLKYYDPPLLEETDEEDNVYPLSIKYNRRKACKIALLRYFYLFVIIILLIPSDIYTLNSGKGLEWRTGYWADKIWEEKVSISGISELAVRTQNCIVYMLEYKESTTDMELFVSAARGTVVSTPLASGIQTINVKSKNSAVQ